MASQAITPGQHIALHENQRNSLQEPSNSTPYKPLGKNEIRLAEIQPACSQARLSCILLHVSEDNLPHYRALSYAWGDPDDLGEIYVEGKVMIVRRCLETALQRLRLIQDSPLLIWVDALCIDQNNLKERAEQVRKMQLIYQNAKEVLIWLGSECDSSPLAWQLIKDFCKCRGGKNVLLGLIQSRRRSQFDALIALFRRPYWWRVWVIQEVACAQKATVYCGSESIAWEDLQAVCDSVKEARDHIRDIIYHDKPALVFSLIRGGPRSLLMRGDSPALFSEGNLPSLLELLRTHMSKLATDPLDKVYGLVGISSDRNSFSIDYNRSVRSTYIYAAQHIISTTQNLDLICLKQNDNNEHNLPSWVPDWERRNLYPKHRVIGLHIRQPSFTAAKSSLAKVSFSQNGEAMTAAGFVIDTITTISEPLYVHGSESDVLPTLKVFHNWWKVFVQARGFNSAEYEVFQRTFLGGAWAPLYSEFEEDRLALFFGLLEQLIPDVLLPSFNHQNEIKSDVLEKRMYAMVASGALRMHAKRFIVSFSKLVGLAPMATEAGDKIAVLLGCAFPVVLREADRRWKLVGEIYVDGLMYGEAMDALTTGKLLERGFEIG